MGDKKVWVLADNRPGNSNQAKALAEILGLDYEVKHLKYNLLANLPNFLKPGLSGIKKEIRQELKKSDAPDIIISAGRRMAAVATAIKRKNPNVKIIQIMKPGLSLKYFDVYITPQHDKKPRYKYYWKTVFIMGAVASEAKDKAQEDRAKLLDKYSAYQEPRIAMLIGGSSKGCNMTVQHANELAELAIQNAQQVKGSLLVTTSRRTPIEVEEAIQLALKNSSITYAFFSPKNALKSQNPYQDFTSIADYFIVTGDSVSMCSEAIESKKPVYVYAGEKMLGKKHMKFINTLFANNYARPLSDQFDKYIRNSVTNSDILRMKIKELIQL